jgi:diguanylate cyclase (GGDEF)-like protein/PAS domain S-box-containing protein
MLESSAAALALIDGEGRILYATPAAEELFRVGRRALEGRALLDIVEPSESEPARELLHEAAPTAPNDRRIELRCRRSDGASIVLDVSWANRFADPEIGAVVATLRDVTDFRRSSALQSVLYRIAARASAVGEMSEFYAAIHAIIGELLDAKNFFIALYDPREDLVTFPYFVDETGGSPKPMRPGPSLTGWILRTGLPLFVTQESFDEMVALGEVDLVGAPSADWLGVPLQIGDETIGVLAVQSYVPTRRYVESEKAVLTFVAQHVAAALSHKRAVEALRASEERYRQLFERNLAGVFRTTADGRVLDCNEAFARLYGYSGLDDLRSIDASALYPEPLDRTVFLERLRSAGALANHEARGRRRDGSLIWTLENVTFLPGGDGEPAILEGTIFDITERKRAEAQIQHLAFHDALTGLPNRALLDDRLALAIARGRRGRSGLALLFVDIDHFKSVNDSRGHGAGDRLLHAVAERLRVCVREEDTVARVGGDEFVIVFHGVSGAADARRMAEKIRAAIALPFAISDEMLAVTASIGIALFPQHGAEPEALIRSADDAMYGVKARGRNGCEVAGS